MASFPLEYPVNITIAPVGTDGFHISWEGTATVFKLAYKRQDATVWQVMAKVGPSTTGGSGNFTDDTPLVSPGGFGAIADFFVTGLVPGVYDIRAINIGGDGTDYTEKTKFLIAELVGEIPGLQLRESPAGQDVISVEWSDPTSNSGQNIFITWCDLRADGKKDNCETKELTPDARSYDIGFREEGNLMIMVSQRHNDAQSALSRELYVHACPCKQKVVGTGGSGGSAEVVELIVGEILTGTKDGINTLFTTLFPIKDYSEEVMINGLTQTRNVHYSVANSFEIHFVDAPASSETLSINYQKQIAS